MKTYKCEEMMCSGCVTRIDKALTEADIKHTISLENKTVTIDAVSYTHLDVYKRQELFW